MNQHTHMIIKEPAERHVVLVAPEVHWNTGNIGRTCLAASACLHLIRPLGFSLHSREVKRAGLDYWHNVELSVWDDFISLKRQMNVKENEIALFTKNGKMSFRSLPKKRRLFLVFGSETKGLPENIVTQHSDATYYIPITNKVRSLNLSTTVGIALYESLRNV